MTAPLGPSLGGMGVRVLVHLCWYEAYHQRLCHVGQADVLVPTLMAFFDTCRIHKQVVVPVEVEDE